jgi:hypothetical protein
MEMWDRSAPVAFRAGAMGWLGWRYRDHRNGLKRRAVHDCENGEKPGVGRFGFGCFHLFRVQLNYDGRLAARVRIAILIFCLRLPDLIAH